MTRIFSIASFMLVMLMFFSVQFVSASKQEEMYEDLLDEQGYVVKSTIITESPTYFKVEVEALDDVTLQCTAYYLDEVKSTDSYRITPVDEEIIFRILDSKVTRFECLKKEE